MSKKVWTTKTGEKIRIKDLSDCHLRNAIFYLKKSAKEMYQKAARSLEPSYYNLHPVYLNREEFDPYFLFKAYPNLRKEAKKRKLCVKLKCECKSRSVAK